MHAHSVEISTFLREINFWHPRSSKNAIFCSFGDSYLIFIFGQFQLLQIAKIYNNKHSDPFNVSKWQFLRLQIRQLWFHRKFWNFHTVGQPNRRFRLCRNSKYPACEYAKWTFFLLFRIYVKSIFANLVSKKLNKL